MLKELNDQKANEIVMVKSVEEKLAKNGQAFVNITITDGKTEMNAKMFNTTKEEFGCKPGDLIEAELRPNLYNGVMSAIVNNFREVDESDGVNADDFIKVPPVGIVTLYDECINAINAMDDEELKELTLKIYTDYSDKFLSWGAAKGVHHNLKGGLIWHSYRMMKSAEAISKVYTAANKDMIIAGCLLHDIGKVDEMDTDPFGICTYTTDGNLFGHLFLGAELVRAYGKQLGTSPEKVRQLSHIIVSHHGKFEYNSIRIPSTLEATLVHYLDEIDSRVYIFEENCEALEPGTFSEKRDIDGAFVYKPLEDEE